MTKIENPPEADDFELSLFGPGIGECVVIHLGDGAWIVVDSCINPDSKRPVALDYFDVIGVDPATSLKAIVITHWHNDHMKGATELVKAAPSALVCCSLALNNTEFKSLLAASKTAFMDDSGLEEFRGVAELVRMATNDNKRKWAVANRELYSIGQAKVTALSPSDHTFEFSLERFAKLLPKKDVTKRRFASTEPNSLSVVLKVEVGGISALLGADLENSAHESRGWNAILNEHSEPKSDIYKVAHHGSSNADDPKIWSELLVPQPRAVVTPFGCSGSPPPTNADRLRMKEQTPHVVLTAETTKKARIREARALKMVKLVAPDISPMTGAMGHVRLRKRLSPNANFRTELFGSAKRL